MSDDSVEHAADASGHEPAEPSSEEPAADSGKPIPQRKSVEAVTIRFAGDSGDGMQLTGDRFTLASAIHGNDLVTFPNYPAEIRAPAGTLAGVSSFQVHFSDHEIFTPGDAPDVLVAMNPAALRSEIDELDHGGTVIVNTDAFNERNLAKAGYESNPLEDGSLDGLTVYEIPMSTLAGDAAKAAGAKPRDAERSKNFFALGVVSWMYTRAIEHTVRWIEDKFAGKEAIIAGNVAALKAGYNFGVTAELGGYRYVVDAAPLAAGEYRSISGNMATAYGIVTAGELAKLPVMLASYPITPASDILHELSKHKHFGVRTMQAEDEIAAAGIAIGAAFSGSLGVTTTSGPGLDLKAEAIGLANQLELPLLIIDIQRGGPSTGLPTKTEQADLLHAMFGRHGESPLPVIAASSPVDCFYTTIEAVRIALTHMTPVILLTDGYLANGSEPWLIPDPDTFDPINVEFLEAPNDTDADGEPLFLPYKRDDRLVRPWAIPGTPGLAHRIGGIEHQDGTGNVDYDPLNHEHMVKLRAERVARVAAGYPALEVDGPDTGLLVVGWGSTFGAIQQSIRHLRESGTGVAHLHLRHMNPFPDDLGEILARYDRVLVPELNNGQLSVLLRAKYLVDCESLTKTQGLPFTTGEIEKKIMEMLEVAR